MILTFLLHQRNKNVAAGRKFPTSCSNRLLDPVTPADVYAGGVSITIPKWQHWAKAAKKKLQEMMDADADKDLAA
ncbi:MAG: hypothetical protein HQM06_08985 [Magnetococcales bacterium]|nr:hypothetical protein [Magnetococcales bacterium]